LYAFPNVILIARGQRYLGNEVVSAKVEVVIQKKVVFRYYKKINKNSVDKQLYIL